MNTIKQPLLPDTIHFNHTIGNDQTEVMRISRDGVWVNPNMPVDDAAKAVLAALDSHIKMLVESAERERKPWIGLTDDERRHLRKCNQQHDAFALAVEALLKEKNQ
jgi:predicted ATPase